MAQLTKVFLAVFALACVSGAFAGRLRDGEGWHPPKWYRGHEGPEFAVLKTLDEVDQRRYIASKWVSTNITGQGWDDAYKQATSRLDDYWNKGNVPEAKLDTTVPTVTLFYPTGQGQTVATTFTIEYFLPKALHGAPPAPKAPELQVVDVQPQDVWVRPFGGYAPEKDVLDQGFGFMEQLKQFGVHVDETVFGVAIYDESSRLVKRHNEIWVWEKPAPSIQSHRAVRG